MRIRTTRLATLAVTAALTLGGTAAIAPAAQATTGQSAETTAATAFRGGFGLVGDVVTTANADGSYTLTWNDNWPGPMRVFASTDAEHFDRVVATTREKRVTITGLDAAKRWYFNVTPVNAKAGVVTAPRDVGLEGAANTRDLGGYTAAFGLTVKWGQVFRTDSLSTLTDAGVAKLGSMDVDVAADFRTDVEIAGNGANRLPSGVTGVELPIADGNLTNIINSAIATGDPVKQQEMLGDGKAAAFLEGVYRNFIDDPAQRAQFAAVYRDIAAGRTTIYNCTAGKDRTGWMSAVILKSLGVSDADVYKDFLLSNDNLKPRNEATKAQLKQHGIMQNPDLLDPLMYVQKSFLDTAFDAVKAEYGSFDAYVSKGLGIDPLTQAKLKTQLLTR